VLCKITGPKHWTSKKVLRVNVNTALRLQLYFIVFKLSLCFLQRPFFSNYPMILFKSIKNQFLSWLQIRTNVMAIPNSELNVKCRKIQHYCFIHLITLRNGSTHLRSKLRKSGFYNQHKLLGSWSNQNDWLFD
jgi:hypothetical protein